MMSLTYTDDYLRSGVGKADPLLVERWINIPYSRGVIHFFHPGLIKRAGAPIFLPYLSGERTPYNDAAATGLFAGLTAGHGQEALVFAVLEGVAFAFADGVDVLVEAGARPIRPLLVGGGARSGDGERRRSGKALQDDAIRAAVCAHRG